MATVRLPQMRNPAARDADHHRLDHSQGQQRGHGGVDRVAAHG